MEDKIGEYGRTNTGKIFIFAWLEKSEGVRDKDRVILIENEKVTNNFYYFDQNERIVKHSKNIIDLIEVGDYVNGYKVISILDDFVEGTMEIELSNHRKIYRTLIENIKSIVTKEQFKSMEYKVGV